MKHLALPLAVVTALFTGPAAGLAGQTNLNGHTFTLPDGFTIELVAGPGLVERPISADFDELGRLYVTDVSGSNDKPDQQLLDKPHRIVRLEDTDGDGRFDRSKVFADKMMLPQGALWFDGSLYVGAPPSIWKLTDTDGDGVAEQRTEWFDGKTLTGCANDLHGPFLGPDGLIYWCKGAFAKQTHERPGRTTISDNAAHVFRRRPDGNGFDSVMSGGMDNPVDVAFNRVGDAFFTTTFFVNPEAGRRDAIVHAIYGGVYPKPNSALDGVKRTGDFLPPLVHLGPAAPAGLTCYESRAFGEGFEGNLFACLFNLHKVTRHALESNGASFKTRDSDFLVSDHPDFHPTDVFEDADGSLLVIDTGGWYKMCCPTSQLAKPDVLGAIYRIRRTGAPVVDDPRGMNFNWAKASADGLYKKLAHPAPAFRTRALHALAKLGTPAIPVITELASRDSRPEARRNAVWVLTRIDGPAARSAVRDALADRDESVRQAAVHSVGIHRDGAALPVLTNLLKGTNLSLQRAAATALGQIGDARALPALLEAAGTTPPRALEHALIYALIELADRAGPLASLRDASPSRRRVALIALDQMDGGKLSAAEATPLLASADALVRDAAVWVTGHHPEWGAELSGYFRARLASGASGALAEPDGDALQKQLTQFARHEAIQSLIAETLAAPATPDGIRLMLLSAMANAGVKTMPTDWGTELQRALASRPPEPVLRAVVAAVRAVPAPKTNATDFTPALLGVARDTVLPVDLRIEALAAIPGGALVCDAETFALLRTALDPARSPQQRNAATGVLARAALTEAQLLELAEVIRGVGPMEISRLLAAYDRSRSESVGLKLIASLKEARALSGLRPDMIAPRLTNYPASVQAQGREVIASLNTDAAKQNAHLDELAPTLKGGDIRRGQAIFNSPKTACASCHAIGYLGGNIGPDLTRIGEIRTERDLLEAIVYPSASFVRSYEPMIVATKGGEEFSGVVKSDSGDGLVLATGVGVLTRLARTDIVEQRPGTVSVMPQGLDAQLSRAELADLMAFLKATRWGAR